MKHLAVAVVLLGVAGSAAEPGAAADAIGNVVRLQGDCYGIAGGVSVALVAGMPVELNETMTTGAGARLELAFDDGTRLTVG
jgi:hypothetical protein